MPKMLRAFFACGVLLVTAQAFAHQDKWMPKASFRIEGANLQQTMLFVSGMAYGLTQYSIELAKSGKPRLFCMPDKGFVTSPIIFEILNSRHSGEKITAEQAATTTMAGLQEKFPCKLADQ